MAIKGKTILVTGGAGFIGSAIARRLAQDNKVVVIDDLSGGYLANIEAVPNLEFVKDDILNANVVDGLFEKHYFDVVFHVAASFANQRSVDNPELDLNINGLGTLRLLEFSRKYEIDRFVYTSSSCVYGSPDEPMREDMPMRPETPYAITKLLGEYYCEYFHNQYGLKTASVRYFNVYGPLEYPGRYRNVAPNFLQKALQREPLPIMGTGKETRDFTYIDDAVDGTLLAAEKDGAVGKVFNIGRGEETNILHLAEMINKLTGNPAGTQIVPRRSWDHIPRRLADNTLARKTLGFKPKVPLEEGLKRTLEWFKANVK